jgi:hypothetical protein
MTLVIETTPGRPGRQCGECTLCCKLLPVRSLDKGAGERCKHQSHARGCKVYATLGRVSPECRLWSCRWLVNDDAGDLRRPDRSHYVLDIMPEYVTHVDGDGLKTPIPVVQIWVDPSHPDAHRDPALRAWLQRRSLAEGVAGLIRYSDTAGLVIFPPNLTGDGQWHEQRSNLSGPTHSIADVARTLGTGKVC